MTYGNQRQRPFRNATRGATESDPARADELTAEELTLAELREVRLRSQAALAAKLGIKQSAVSRLERRADMYLSTLNSLIEAMGGSLQIIAQFPDRPAVRIKQFRALD